MTAFFSCSGAEVKTDEKSEENKEVKKEEEPKKAEVVPQIDVEGLKEEAAIIDAMTKVVAARKMDDSLSEADKNYKGHYVELLKLETAVRKKNLLSSQKL